MYGEYYWPSLAMREAHRHLGRFPAYFCLLESCFDRRGVTVGIGTQCLSRVTESGETTPYRRDCPLEFKVCNFTDTIATLTTCVSAFGPLSFEGKSLGVEGPVRIQVVILLSLRAHHTRLYLSLRWTSGGDPSSPLVRGIPTAKK